MSAYFCDTSAIIKRYIKEKGSQFVESIADLKSGNKIFLAQIAQVEIAAAIAHKRGDFACDETRFARLRRGSTIICAASERRVITEKLVVADFRFRR